MKVYKLRFDVEHYQIFLLEPGYSTLEYMKFYGEPIGDWTPPHVYSDEPDLWAGDFWEFGGAPAFPSRTLDLCGKFFGSAGQTLPLLFEAETFHVLNVTVKTDCLDHDRVEWIYGNYGTVRGKPLRVKKFVFLREALPQSSIFKVPSAPGTVLCYEGVKANPDDEFKPFVEKHGLTGLIFTELWSSEE